MSWRLAIDFGTSSTAAAMGRGGLVEPVPVEGRPSILSNVFWHEPTHQLLLGEAADNAAEVAPWCFEPYPKRKLGDEFMRLGDERIRVTDAVGAILRRVADEAILLRGGEQPDEIRLTHPVRWGATRRAKLREAATGAGLTAPDLVPEPVAAATHYAAEALTSGQHVAVYDLGGGTLDTAVLCRTDDDFVVVGQPGGREDLGGEDFDERLYLFLGEQLPEEVWTHMRTAPVSEETRVWARANRELRRRARRAKELLSSNAQVDVYVPAPVECDLIVTADQLNRMIHGDIADSIAELDRTINAAGLKPSQLAAVYLTGGSSRIPLVAHLIEQRLGVTPRHLDDPKAVVSLGAARGTRPNRRPRAPAVVPKPEVDQSSTPESGPQPRSSRDPRLAGHASVGEQRSDPVLTASAIAPERALSPGRSGVRAAGATAVVGVLAVFASLFLPGLATYRPWHTGSGSGTWMAHYPIGMTAICVVLLVLIGSGVRSGRRGTLLVAAGLAFALLGESFPLSWGRQFGDVQGGFWLGVGGASVAAIGTVTALRLTDLRAPTTAQGERPESLSVRGRVSLILLGPLILVTSLFLHRQYSESTWNRVATNEPIPWGHHYSIALILVCGLIIALGILGIRRNRQPALIGAAVLACFVVGEAYPLFDGDYGSLQIGFWLGVMGAIVAVVGSTVVAAAASRNSPSWSAAVRTGS
jgi:hypothetical protein